MEISNNYQLIGKRIIWKKIQYLIYSVIFTSLSIYFVFLIINQNVDNFYIILLCLLIILSFYLIVVTIISFFEKNDAIYINCDSLIIRMQKDIIIPFIEIEDIQKNFYKYRIGKKRFSNYNFGNIVIVLKNQKKFYVKNIKEVNYTCIKLKEMVFKSVQDHL